MSCSLHWLKCFKNWVLRAKLLWRQLNPWIELRPGASCSLLVHCSWSFLSLCPQIRLHIGMYSVYFERWLVKITPEQLFITTLEEYKESKNSVVNEILQFLDVGWYFSTALNVKIAKCIFLWPELWERRWRDRLSFFSAVPSEVSVSGGYYNRRRQKEMMKGDMLEKTRLLLDHFYRPFNKRLVELLGQGQFLWNWWPLTSRDETCVTCHTVEIHSHCLQFHGFLQKFVQVAEQVPQNVSAPERSELTSLVWQRCFSLLVHVAVVRGFLVGQFLCWSWWHQSTKSAATDHSGTCSDTILSDKGVKIKQKINVIENICPTLSVNVNHNHSVCFVESIAMWGFSECILKVMSGQTLTPCVSKFGTTAIWTVALVSKLKRQQNRFQWIRVWKDFNSHGATNHKHQNNCTRVSRRSWPHALGVTFTAVPCIGHTFHFAHLQRRTAKLLQHSCSRCYQFGDSASCFVFTR